MNRARILWTAAALAATASGWLYHFATTPPPDLSRHSVSTTPDPYAGIATEQSESRRSFGTKPDAFDQLDTIDRERTAAAQLALECERLDLERARLELDRRNAEEDRALRAYIAEQTALDADLRALNTSR